MIKIGYQGRVELRYSPKGQLFILQKETANKTHWCKLYITLDEMAALRLSEIRQRMYDHLKRQTFLPSSQQEHNYYDDSEEGMGDVFSAENEKVGYNFYYWYPKDDMQAKYLMVRPFIHRPDKKQMGETFRYNSVALTEREVNAWFEDRVDIFILNAMNEMVQESTYTTNTTTQPQCWQDNQTPRLAKINVNIWDGYFRLQSIKDPSTDEFFTSEQRPMVDYSFNSHAVTGWRYSTQILPLPTGALALLMVRIMMTLTWRHYRDECIACQENQPNQEAHKKGCMEGPNSEDTANVLNKLVSYHNKPTLPCLIDAVNKFIKTVGRDLYQSDPTYTLLLETKVGSIIGNFKEYIDFTNPTPQNTVMEMYDGWIPYSPTNKCHLPGWMEVQSAHWILNQYFYIEILNKWLKRIFEIHSTF